LSRRNYHFLIFFISIKLFLIRQALLLLTYDFILMIRLPQKPTLFPYTTLFRSGTGGWIACGDWAESPSLVWLIFLSSFPWAEYRSEEHTSELQSRSDIVCRLLLEKKNGLEQGEDMIMRDYTLIEKLSVLTNMYY